MHNTNVDNYEYGELNGGVMQKKSYRYNTTLMVELREGLHILSPHYKSNRFTHEIIKRNVVLM